MEEPELRRHLRVVLEAGVTLGGFALALAAPGPLAAKLAIGGAITAALLLVAVWHHGYRTGRRDDRRRRRPAGRTARP